MVENKEPKPKRSRGYGPIQYASTQIRSGFVMGVYSIVRWVFGLFIIGLIIFFLLSGVINQRKTGESVIQYALGTGERIGDFFYSLTNKSSPLKLTEEGVYFKEADPGANPLEGIEIDEVDRLEEWVDDRKETLDEATEVTESLDLGVQDGTNTDEPDENVQDEVNTNEEVDVGE